MVLSSAYIVACAFFKAKVRSLTYSKKRRGPRHEPCGTPMFFRGDAIDIAELLAVIQIRTEPIMLDAIDAIMMHFSQGMS